MTGTSCDGLDASCLEFDIKNWNKKWKILWSKSIPYPTSLRKRVFDLQDNKEKLDRLIYSLELHRDLGRWYGSALKNICKSHSIDAIASHGQTLFHQPQPHGNGLTLQLGDPSHIAHLTGLTVLSHFRNGDIAAGGQGAPLVPLYHRFLIKKIGLSPAGISVHNLGGISNFTYFQSENKIISFDTGPGNVWIDAATRIMTHGKKSIDHNGQIAKNGLIDKKAVARILKHPYFKKNIPKSTGRDDFPIRMLTQNTHAKNASLVATATALTAESIALAYQQWILKQHLPLHTIYLSGGGAKNLFLISLLKKSLPGTQVLTLESLGLNGQEIESQAFAFLGFQSLLGNPLGGPWTNPGHKFFGKNLGPPAQITPGKNWTRLLKKLNQ